MTRMERLVIVPVASKENTCAVNLAYFLDYWFKRMLLGGIGVISRAHSVVGLYIQGGFISILRECVRKQMAKYLEMTQLGKC